MLRTLAAIPFLFACSGSGSSSDGGTAGQAGTAGGAMATGGSGGTSTGGAGGSAGATGGAAGTSGTGGVSGGGTGGSSGAGTGGSSGASTGGVGGTAGMPTGGTGGGTPSSGYSIRFFGNGGLDDDRVKWRIDDPATVEPGPALDVGADDFTIEFWMKATAADNPNPALNCGPNNDWTTSNLILDRDRHSPNLRSMGIGVAGGVVIFAVEGDVGIQTRCGQTQVLDNNWHHIAVTRSFPDGFMQIFVDGNLDESGDGPDGDVSYPDDGVPENVCPGGLCDYSDPFLVLGAEKHGYPGISYNGFVDELRISTTIRYTTPFTPPTAPFVDEPFTVGLFHFDETSGTTAFDSSNPPGGPTHGTLNVGGSPQGPVWVMDSPFP